MVENAVDSIINVLISIARSIFTISVRFFMNTLSCTTKSITPYVATSVLFKLFLSTALSIEKCIPHMLQCAELFWPSNLKYPFTYALHLEHLNGVCTRTLWTNYDPNGVIQIPKGKLDFFGFANVIAEVGLTKSGPAS